MTSRLDKNNSAEVGPAQLHLDFEAVIRQAQIRSRDEVASQLPTEDGAYDPIEQTARYMQRAVESEMRWETTLQKARSQLLKTDARELYFNFIEDLARRIEQDPSRAPMLANILETVLIRGLGMSQGYGQHYLINKPMRGATRWRVRLDANAIRVHLNQHIVGENFLNVISAATTRWGDRPPTIGASDVSQHTSKIPIPAPYFKRSVPFVLNNAAGTLFRMDEGKPQFDNVFNPKPDESLLRWMLIDPSYQDELEPEDYRWCIASSMDVGQYRFDLEYLLKADRRPDVIFRDGTLFPQDAHIDNFVIPSKRGDFTREAIREFLSCLSYSRDTGTIYCGISKAVQLKVFSAVVDWYVETHIDPNWTTGNYTLNDGQAMSLLLSSPDFVASNLDQVLCTCLIRRSFTTRASLNSRINLDTLPSFFAQKEQENREIDFAPYRRLCETGHIYTFFIGHSKNPQQQLPRYEFFYFEELGSPMAIAHSILSAIQQCGLMGDSDHSFMSTEPVTYLLPSVTQHAHLLSKDVGRYIDSATGQWIMSRYQKRLGHHSSNG